MIYDLSYDAIKHKKFFCHTRFLTNLKNQINNSRSLTPSFCINLLQNKNYTMQIQTIIEDIEYLNCITHKQELSIVCLQKDCYNKMLLCPLCEQTHPKHSTIPLKQYLKNVTIKSEKQSFQQLLKANKMLNVIHQDIKQQLRSMRQSIDHQLLQLENNIELYFNQIANKLVQVYRYKDPKFIKKSILGLTAQKADTFQLSFFLQNLQTYKQFSFSQALQYYISDAKLKINQVRQSVNKFNHQTQINKAKSYLLTISKPLAKVNYSWSNLRSSKIIIKDNIASQSGSMSNGQRFALLQPEEKNGIDRNFRVAFKVNKLKGWIGLGICLKDVIIKAGYKFNYTIPFHGSYLVSANGYSWSHSQPECNSSCKSFTFGQGDTVFIEYDNKEKKVTFQSIKPGIPKFVLNTIQPPYDDCYLPCVNLCNPGDEVELINSLQ